jgi:SAM-dependent methyltransferase
MDRINSRQALFYAEAEAGIYDRTIEWVVPHYASLHETIRELLKAQRDPTGSTSVALDVGSGTGTESRSILAELPNAHVIALDVCAPIQTIHRAATSSSDLCRMTFVTDDVVNCLDHPTGLKQWLPRDSPGYGIIATAFAVHHLSHAAKTRFYQAAFDALRPGGRLVNGDLFSLSDPLLDRLALEYNLQWIRAQFAAAVQVGEIEAPVADELSGRWTAHYLEENLCEPLEDSRERRGQIGMMVDAGFDGVSVIYRHSMTGVLTGVRPL